MVIPGLHRRLEVNTTYNNTTQPNYNNEPQLQTNFMPSAISSNKRTRSYLFPEEIHIQEKTNTPNFSILSSGNDPSDVSTSFRRDNYNATTPMKPQALVTNISTLNYQELYQQCMNLHKENKILKNNVTPACRRKVRKQKKHKQTATMFEQQFPSICKAIARNHIWKYVKYISDESMLENYIDPKSIGYKFFKYYKNQSDTDKSLENDADIWEEAKDYIYEAIAAKRNAIQTKIKNCFKGTYMTSIFSSQIITNINYRHSSSLNHSRF